MTRYGYIRTSTDKQLCDRQINQLTGVCDQVFVEDGVSAVRKHRPVYEKLMRKIEPGDVFIVLSLDRAYRSVLDALTELDKLHKRDIAFRSLTQNFDTTTPEGRLLYTVCAALSEWERSILSERTKQGMEAARRRGKRIGRPPKLSEDQILWARRRLKHAPSGQEINRISRMLHVSQRTLLRNVEASFPRTH